MFIGTPVCQLLYSEVMETSEWSLPLAMSVESSRGNKP